MMNFKNVTPQREDYSKGFSLFKNTALNLSKEISLFFENDDTPVILPEKKLQFESDKLRVTIIFEELE